MTTENEKNKIIEATQDVLKQAGFEGEVKLIDTGFDNNSFPVVSIESDKDLSMLIGRSGQNLSAFEHIVKIIAARRLGRSEDFDRKNFVIDINDYRKARATHVLGLAKSAAQRVISTQRAEALLPMSPYERRLVHTELAGCKEIQTESIGEEPRRRVVIKPLSLGGETL